MAEIETLRKWKDSESYRTGCQCMSSEHDLNFSVQYEEDVNMVSLLVTTEIGRRDWNYSSIEGVFVQLKDKFMYGQSEKETYSQIIMEGLEDLTEKWKRRFCDAFKVFFTGHLEMDGDFIFRGEDQIDEFISVLQDASARIKTNRKV